MIIAFILGAICGATAVVLWALAAAKKDGDEDER